MESVKDNEYETDSYNNNAHFDGDVDDFENFSSDAPGHHAASSQGSHPQQQPKPLFLIKTSEYLTGYKERVLGEQIEKYEQVRREHMKYRLNGWDSDAGRAALERSE